MPASDAAISAIIDTNSRAWPAPTEIAPQRWNESVRFFKPA